jgi:hypothetical protein
MLRVMVLAWSASFSVASSAIASSTTSHVLRDRLPPDLLQAAPLADRQHHRFEHRHAREQGVDLEGARHAALDALVLRQGVMSSPPSQTLPRWAKPPVSRLMKVVLPAPFGPISAWRAPGSNVRLTSLLAA